MIPKVFCSTCGSVMIPSGKQDREFDRHTGKEVVWFSVVCPNKNHIIQFFTGQFHDSYMYSITEVK